MWNKRKSPQSEKDYGDFLVSLPTTSSTNAKLAHEILQIIVHRKVDQLAFLIKYLLEFIFYIDGIASAGHIHLRGL